MISLTDEMRELVDGALANRTPCILGTASSDGHPMISFKGSVMVYDEQSLAYWERAKPIGRRAETSARTLS